MTLTTLQLARKVAEAVLFAAHDPMKRFCPSSLPDHEHPPTQAVLRTLHATGSWFCRMSEDEKGNTVQQPYETVQMDLFAESTR